MKYSKEFIENVCRRLHIDWWDSSDNEELKELWIKHMTEALIYAERIELAVKDIEYYKNKLNEDWPPERKEKIQRQIDLLEECLKEARQLS